MSRTIVVSVILPFFLFFSSYVNPYDLDKSVVESWLSCVGIMTIE